MLMNFERVYRLSPLLEITVRHFPARIFLPAQPGRGCLNTMPKIQFDGTARAALRRNGPVPFFNFYSPIVQNYPSHSDCIQLRFPTNRVLSTDILLTEVQLDAK
jgi:hypothetical protein